MHVEEGSHGLQVSHEAVAVAASVEQAVEHALRQLQPSLAPGCGEEAFGLTSPEHPLLLLVDDINRSSQPQLLTERLVRWVTGAGTEAGGLPARKRWRLICPLWPEVVAALDETSKKALQGRAIYSGPMSPVEGCRAVRARAAAANVTLSELDAASVSKSLGHDPLLIALHQPGAGFAGGVIESYIDSSVIRLATEQARLTAGEYRDALRALAAAMLERRRLDPTWREAASWLGDAHETRAALRDILHHGEIARLSGSPHEEWVSFRHDRVRDFLLADAIAARLREGRLNPEVVADPFYAEHVGAALLRPGVPVEFVGTVREANPLALFHALRLFGEPSGPVETTVVTALRAWLGSNEARLPRFRRLRW